MMRLRGDISPYRYATADAGRYGTPAVTSAQTQHRKILEEEGGVDYSYVVGKTKPASAYRCSNNAGVVVGIARVNSLIRRLKPWFTASHRTTL